MKPRDHSRALAVLGDAYAAHSPSSARLHMEAQNYLVDGGSHNLRLIQPFPPRIARAAGAWLEDVDGHRILDYWQGHYTNILGHNPPVVTEALSTAFKEGFGLQTGFTDLLQIEVAELLCRRTGAERVRFTTSGSLTTMYAVLLARAFTGRDRIMKIGGGWHGAQPWGLKGVDFHDENHSRFQHVDTRGLPEAIAEEVLVTRFNDPQMLSDHFRRYGDTIACFIVEPFIGAGGFLPADREYLNLARELATRYGTVLILDEVISGFRFHAGSLGQLYGVQPDLATYAKVIGGGMPVAAVGGRTEIMKLAGRGGGVMFSGGTYSGHPASLLASLAVMRHLVEQEAVLYPRLADLGRRTRRAVEEAFASEGLLAVCTGDGNEAVPGSSLGMVLFPHREGTKFRSPEDTRNPEICDVVLSDKVLQLALLLEQVHVVHGLGAVSAAHTQADTEYLVEACRRAARRIRSLL
jgi:glutamate-1-semialdehyde 2,1-aminomutase